MKIEKMNMVMNTLIAGSSLAVFMGALMKLWHNPTGELILWGGFVTYIILSSIEISRLKKIIARSKRVVNPDDLAF